MSTPLARFAAVTLSVALSLAANAARADQFVAMDQTWTHTPDLADSHFRVTPSAETPADWTSPVDYSNGTAWVYLEVHTKPTAQPTKFQVCFEATPTYACTDQSPTYTATGTYQWSTPFASFWSPPNTSVDWTKGVNKLACILKDTMNNKPSADNVGATEAALYTPTDVRMVVTIVAPGSTYVPPTPTGQGGAGGSGGQGAATSSAASTSAAGPTSTSSGVDGTTTGSGAGGSSGINIHDPKSGCGISTGDETDSTWLFVAGGGLVLAKLTRRARRAGLSSRKLDAV